ncbi:MAG: hypothetical protein ACODAU_00780 [Myxococcota bacterium]
MRERADPRQRVREAVDVRPVVAGPVASSVRSMLAEHPAWREVRSAYGRCRPQDVGWLDEPIWSLWVDADRHVALLDSAAEAMGLEGLRDLGRRRLAAELKSGIFASIVRSWLRSFAEHPGYLLRVAPYLWRAGFRDCGEVTLAEAQDHMLRYRLSGAPANLRDSEAWRALVEGFVQGLYELAGVQGELHFESEANASGVVEIVARWQP